MLNASAAMDPGAYSIRLYAKKHLQIVGLLSIMDEVTSVIQQLSTSRGNFFRRPLQPGMVDIADQFLRNESLYLSLLASIVTLRATPTPIVFTIPFHVPDSLMEPVPVVPTEVQVTGELQPMADTTSQASCAVCQDTIATEGCSLRGCGHSFHTACIRTWFNASVRCPVCRRDIREAPSNQTVFASQQTPSQ